MTKSNSVFLLSLFIYCLPYIILFLKIRTKLSPTSIWRTGGTGAAIIDAAASVINAACITVARVPLVLCLSASSSAWVAGIDWRIWNRHRLLLFDFVTELWYSCRHKRREAAGGLGFLLGFEIWIFPNRF